MPADGSGMEQTSTIDWRTADHASWQGWESDDWRWHITSRPVNMPDNGGPRVYSVKDCLPEGGWVDEDFDTFEDAAAYCERVNAADRAELRKELGL